MKKLFLLLLFFPSFLFAQVFDDFEDGDFTQNPTWTGSQEKFKVNDNKQLQLNDTATGLSYLSTVNHFMGDAEWRCWVKLSFSPSANNNTRVYLVSDNENTGQSLNGYFLQLGESGSDDAIELFRQNGETITSVCRGTDGLIASSFTIRLKVLRDNTGLWKVFADPLGGENYQLQCEGTDNSFTTTAYFGFYCKYTVSNSTKFYFDDVYAGPVVVDNDPPELINLMADSDNTLTLNFNESLDKTSAETLSNYSVNKAFGNPKSAVLNSEDATQVHLLFSNKFNSGESYLLSVSGIEDLSGNVMEPQDFPFSFYRVQAFDVVFNEIMADPSPPVGLPNYEYLELFNTTNLPIDLNRWTLIIGSSEKSFENTSISPKGYLILAKEDAETELGAYGPFYGFSSFSLTNSGQTLKLVSAEGDTISAVQYDDSWYKDPDKEDGGWSLEQINPANICSGEDNWQASENGLGGTPGAINSVNNDLLLLPRLNRLEVVANNILRLFFNQAMEVTTLSDVENYTVDHEIGNPSNVYLNQNEPGQAELYFQSAFNPGFVYELTISKNLQNCMGLTMAADTIIQFGLGETADSNDIVINEILFNPWTNGVDYVEIYNRSNKVIDLSLLKLGTGKISPPNPIDTSYYSIVNEQFLMVPGTYLTLTSSPAAVKKQYSTSNPDGFISIDPFPAYNNDEGICLLADGKGQIIDAFDYSEEMHYPLLNYVDGVSLERTNFDAQTQLAGNWHSAAESVGFGTPSIQNSQFIDQEKSTDEVVIDPEIFSPDNDGYNDIQSIKYTFEQPGFMMTVNIYNAGGQLVRKLVNNEYLGTEGTVNWDGLQDDNTKAPIGIYIYFIQVFDLAGTVKKYKKTGVLGGKL
jgi:hypothetical protein